MQEKLVGYQMLPATVVSNSAERVNNYLVIDKGETDGVKPEMGVVGGGGVVGIVYLTGPHHALVLPATNRKSSISCKLRGQNYFGYLEWNEASRRSAFLDDIPRYAQIKKDRWSKPAAILPYSLPASLWAVCKTFAIRPTDSPTA